MQKTLAVVLALVTASGALGGGITQQYGYDFLPIRDAGNASYGYTDPDSGEYVEVYGGVNHEYRISRTATTTTQWSAFLNDFSAAFGAAPVAGTSLDQIRSQFTVPGSNGFQPFQGYEQHPVTAPWRGAAIYCNWLHHGQTSDPDKLLVGAYDATTFGNDGPFSPTDQYTTLPGARFWIPTRDEYAKAAYYDPNRYGEEEGGYWLYPDASDTPLIPGLPEDGGETNGFNNGSGSNYMAVGSYPDVQSAFGMLDVSGGVPEWTSSENINRQLYVKRNSGGIDEDIAAIWDHIDYQFESAAFPNGRAGIRIATLIPTPASLGVLGLGAIGFARRRR